MSGSKSWESSSLDTAKSTLRACPTASRWECAACTFQNVPSASVCTVCTHPRKVSEFQVHSLGGSVAKYTQPARETVRGALDEATEPAKKGAKVKCSKVAETLAAEHGVNLALITGSGKNGTITKADVEGHLGLSKARKTPTTKRARTVEEGKNGNDETAAVKKPRKKTVATDESNVENNNNNNNNNKKEDKKAGLLPPLDARLQVEPAYSPSAQDIIAEFAKGASSHSFKFAPRQIQSALELLQAENTVAFITRYRKELTGGMQENDIRDLSAAFEKFNALIHRKVAVLKLIASQHQLSAYLRQNILHASDLKTVEDLYLPYKPKRESLASAAKNLGLSPLANLITSSIFSEQHVRASAEKLVGKNNAALSSVEECVRKALHIIAEECAERPEIRDLVRAWFRRAKLVTTRKPVASNTANIDTSGHTDSTDEHDTKRNKNSKNNNNNNANNTDAETAALKFKDYFDWSRVVSELKSHQVLAVNRGESLHVLNVKLVVDVPLVEKAILNKFAPFAANGYQHELLTQAVHDSYHRLIAPSLTRELRRELTSQAVQEGIAFFCRNLKSLLMTQPLKGMRVLGIDPGFRSGCKLAAIDETGKLLGTGVIHPHSGSQASEASHTVLDFIRRFHVQHIAIGSGTASRETEQFISQVLKSSAPQVQYGIVNEDGASVYSVSALAQKEFPELTASFRGTVSIARRLQDPLAELIKIDPQSIGVGMYQHDMPKSELTKSVDGVVEDCVSLCGVDVNTASVQLLTRVAGLSSSRAAALCAHRDSHGRFDDRTQVLKVKGIGKRSFEQAAGFLMVYGGTEPLDSTLVHPESYELARELMKVASISPDLLVTDQRHIQQRFGLPEVASKVLDLGKIHGLQTVHDIAMWLSGRGIDPRTQPPALRNSALDISTLQEGTIVTAVVKNVVAFGAFCDVGIGVNGLLHNSELGSNRATTLSVGQLFPAVVKKVELTRNRVSLSIAGPGLGPPRP